MTGVQTCALPISCYHNKAIDGTPCGSAGICLSGQCSIGSDLSPAPSCKAILDTIGSNATSGVYWLKAAGANGAKYQAYCDMVSDGGGWTLLMKLDGNTNQFVYDSALWTDQNALNPNLPDLDVKEAKLASFWSVPFTELRVGMTKTDVKSAV